MKRMICLITVMMICMSLVIPAFAAEDTFVPSIGYKDGPDIIDGEMDDQDVKDCLVVTTLKQAREKTTDVSQATRDLLLNIYESLKNDDMKLPMEGGYIVRELVDVSWKQKNCVENPEHTHDEDLEKEGIVVTIDLDMRLSAKYDIAVFAYRNGQWGPIEKAEINEDGSVTCVFEHFCPVAFCVRERTGGSETGDPAGQNLILWIVLMAASTCAIAVLVYNRRKHSR